MSLKRRKEFLKSLPFRERKKYRYWIDTHLDFFDMIVCSRKMYSDEYDYILQDLEKKNLPKLIYLLENRIRPVLPSPSLKGIENIYDNDVDMERIRLIYAQIKKLRLTRGNHKHKLIKSAEEIDEILEKYRSDEEKAKRWKPYGVASMAELREKKIPYYK